MRSSRILSTSEAPSRLTAAFRGLYVAAILCALMIAGCAPSSGQWATFLEDRAREALAAYLF